MIVDVLYDSFEKYNWVGIYFVKGNELVLGPWKGKQATEHTKIPIGTRYLWICCTKRKNRGC